LIKCLNCGNNDNERFGVGIIRNNNTYDYDSPPRIEIDYWKFVNRKSEIFAHVCDKCGFVMLFDEIKLA